MFCGAIFSLICSSWLSLSRQSLVVGSFSYRSVVVMMIVTFWFLLMLMSRFIRSAVFSSSMLDIGSSAMIIFGLFASALIMAIRCFSPPERFSGKRSARCSSWK